MLCIRSCLTRSQLNLGVDMTGLVSRGTMGTSIYEGLNKKG
jgi:hypothetical protein